MNEILQQRTESVQAGKNITHAQIQAKRSLREQLENDVEAFLKNGGKVETLPQGYTGEFSQFNGRPVGGAQKSMRNVMAASVAAAHARRNNPNVIARNKAREEGQKHFHGAECVSCGGTLRYTSTNSCFSCNKASALRTHKRRTWRAA
ncbi:hypothetical protein KMZ14_06335 [Acinetobacter schindleri]|uniref:hypothetical protein n=1 Tax=Acinetobacter schindleri TaxID=108981 RepID=UPI0023615F59|nr:hypothetical protein [Acinetobacter schindleri]WDE17147.1 hypothetical protein KMZ14_06335 [Acinetobacter schindleri]